MSYAEIVSHLESRGVMPDRPPSLEPTRLALRELDFRIDPDRVVIVAGTNGKGSICATLEALLSAAGERVGLYTSPHLISATERIRVAGADISEELFCEAYRQVRGATTSMTLSHFEMLTVMAIWVFSSGAAIPPVDRIVLEVGLGGAWDATNAVPHHWAVIASLGMDHESLLGSSLAEIASNKFGVVTPGATVIHSPLPEEVVPLARSVQSETQSSWHEAIPFGYRVDHGDPPRFTIKTLWGEAALALPGYRGAQNTATALTAFKAMGHAPERFLRALPQVRWPGRMTRAQASHLPCPVYFSGDHNPHGIQSLLELLPYFRRNRLHLLLGIGKDKDLEGMMRLLTSDPGLEPLSIYFTETPFRGRPLLEYGAWLERASGAWTDPQTALGNILERAAPGDLVLVTGSLYLVGLLLKSF